MFNKLKAILENPLIRVIAISLLITCTVSLVFGLAFYLYNNHFWTGFVSGFGIQFIIFAIVNTFLLRKDAITSSQIVQQQLEAISKFTISLTCAYCKQTNPVPIQLNQENRFTCEHCKQVNGVKMQFISTQITTPLERLTFPIDESVPLKSTLD
jgi:hypothetical protein